MPCDFVGFMLKPYGFFKFNPTLDLPPDTNKASKQYQGPQGAAGGGGDGRGGLDHQQQQQQLAPVPTTATASAHRNL